MLHAADADHRRGERGLGCPSSATSPASPSLMILHKFARDRPFTFTTHEHALRPEQLAALSSDPAGPDRHEAVGTPSAEDLALIAQLADDGRRSFANLAAAVERLGEPRRQAGRGAAGRRSAADHRRGRAAAARAADDGDDLGHRAPVRDRRRWAPSWHPRRGHVRRCRVGPGQPRGRRRVRAWPVPLPHRAPGGDHRDRPHRGRRRRCRQAPRRHHEPSPPAASSRASPDPRLRRRAAPPASHRQTPGMGKRCTGPGENARARGMPTGAS